MDGIGFRCIDKFRLFAHMIFWYIGDFCYVDLFTLAYVTVKVVNVIVNKQEKELGPEKQLGPDKKLVT